MLCDSDLEGRRGGGGGREGIYVYVWLIHIVVQQKPRKKIVKQLSSPIKKKFKQTNKLHGRAESSG